MHLSCTVMYLPVVSLVSALASQVPDEEITPPVLRQLTETKSENLHVT